MGRPRRDWEHRANHPLPISNGYHCQSSGIEIGPQNLITVYCGRCKEYFIAHREWVERYLSAMERDLKAATQDASEYGISQARMDMLMSEAKEKFKFCPS